MKFKHYLILILIAVALAAAVGYRLYVYYNTKAAVKPRGAAVAVETVMPETRAMRDLRLFTGTLSARLEFDAAAKVGGRVIAVPVSFGDRVSKGSLLAQIDPEDCRRELEQAEAACEITAAQLKEARVTLELRQKEYRRQQELGRATSKAALDSAESTFHAQEATVIMKGAELKKQQSALHNAQTRLSDTTVTLKVGDADSRFFVADTYVDPGALVKDNERLLRIVDIGSLKANIYVIERDYNHLKLGQVAEITTDAYPGRVFSAAITQISQEVQKNTRQARVAVRIPNDDLLLKPGMFVRVNIEFARNPAAQCVPRGALLRRNGGNVVFLYDKVSETALMVPVKTGIAENDFIEIVSPKLSKPVITLGNHLLSPGIAVRPAANAVAATAEAATK